MSTTPQPGSCYEFTEDIFGIKDDKYYHIGKRSVTGKVLSVSSGFYNLEVLGSKGINPVPRGVTIQRGAANLVHVVDCTNKLPSYVLTTYSSDQTFKAGGHVEGVKDGKKVVLDTAAQGGIGVGASHAENGIKGEVGTEKRPIEFEGKEIILTAPVATNDKTYDFQGKQLTGREIASKINQDNGGVSFADGGTVPSCRCRGGMYEFGGENISDFQVIERINRCGCDHEQERLEILKQLDRHNITVDEAFEKINKTF